MSELCSDVWVPEHPLKDEHGQTHDVAVALQRDQLPENGLGTYSLTLKTKPASITFADPKKVIFMYLQADA